MAIMAVRAALPYDVRPLYDEARNHAARMSLPFRMIGPRGLSALPFWKNDARSFSLLQFDQLMEDELGRQIARQAEWLRPPEIHIRSAFYDRHGARELDRSARIVLDEVFRASKYDFVSLRNLPQPLKRALQGMQHLLANEELSDDAGEALVGYMGAIRHLFSDPAHERAGITPHSWKKRGQIMSLIDDAVMLWSNREISVDLGWKQDRKQDHVAR
jgi:hypothetical protein